MRLLTFIQMAENQTEMTFDTLMQELQLNVDDVEGFIIEGKQDSLSFLMMLALARLLEH